MATERKSKRTSSAKPAGKKTAGKSASRSAAGNSGSKRTAVKSTKAATPVRAARPAAKASKAEPKTARPPRKSAAPPAPVGTELQERLQLMRQEKAELQEILRQMRAERDSALAETTRLQDRVRELESETTRRSGQEPQQAGPGGFDPTVDLEEDGGALSEDDLEGAAGFFDRIDELRARRVELDRERADRELEQSDQSFWMVCPKCGDLMEEQESENIKMERCETCGGVYFDRGEADLLVSLTADQDGLRRLHSILRF